VQVEFVFPWALLLIPAFIGLTVFLYRKYAYGVGKRGAHACAVLGMRFLVIALVVLALASPSILTRSNQAATWVLLNVSDSTLALRNDMESAVAQGLASKPDDLQAGVIAFGGDAMVEVPLSRKAAFTHAETSVDPAHSNAAMALGLSGALLPSDAAGRMMLVSDGSIGNTDAQAALLKARGIAVDVMPFSGPLLKDAQVTSLSLPSKAFKGQSVQVTVEMDATMDSHGTLILYANREPVNTKEVSLRRGKNTFVFTDTAKASGVVTYEAQLIVPGDEQTRNNRMGSYMAVLGQPTVLIVEGREDESRELGKILDASGFHWEAVTPAGMPQSAEALRKYDATVLVNADADTFSSNALSALDAYVKTLGRGLTVIGGDQSYALGGYRGSRLEDMLPVTIDVRNQMDLPSLALMLVIDKSGSMTGGQFGTTRLEVAKEAAMRSVEVLTGRDQVGVIAFDDAAKWVVPLQNAADIAAIQDAIGTIRPGGGTAFYTPLYETMTALMSADAKLKHVIFLTDGEAGDNGFDLLVKNMAQNGITLTTVAVGSGANVKVLSRLAEIGNGRAYAAGEFDNIPKIFTKETYLVTGSYVQNRIFTPVVTEISALTDFAGFPRLSGYLAATEKPMATVSMVSDREDPLLAWWQYGAGRVLAWTSDIKGAWTGQFLKWDQASAFFSGLVSHVLPEGGQEGELNVQTEGTQAKVTYTAPAEAENENLETSAHVLMPDGAQTDVELTEVEPGEYEGSFDAPQQGAYAIKVEQMQNGQTVRQLEGGAVRSYSEEYDLRRQGGAEDLTRLANATGGRVITDPGEMFTARGTEAQSRRMLRPLLLALALVLFLLDIALRRLSLDKMLAKVFGAAKEKAEASLAKRREKPQRPVVAKPGKKKNAPVAVSATDMADNLLKARDKKKHL
jgi:uncharacterized membrane protein